MESIDLRRIHLVVADSLAKLGTRWMFRIVPVTMVMGFFDRHFGLLPFAIVAARLAWCAIGWLVRPTIAMSSGLEIDGRLHAWEETTRITPTRVRIELAGYRCTFAWLRVGWRPYFLVGEKDWLAAIAQMQSRPRPAIYR